MIGMCPRNVTAEGRSKQPNEGSGCAVALVLLMNSNQALKSEDWVVGERSIEGEELYYL